MSEQQLWYYLDTSGQQAGPVSADEMKQLAVQQLISAQTQVWTEGLTEWVAASTVEGLIVNQPILAATTPLIPSTPTTQPVLGRTAVTPVAQAYATPDTNPELSAETGQYPQTISKGGSFGLVCGLLFGGMAVLTGGAILASKPETAALGVGIVIAGYIAFIFLAVLNYIYLYRAWVCLQPGGASVSPGKAVGFLFIPFFNIYWIFIAFGSLPRQWNEIVARYENTRSAPRLSLSAFILMLLVPVIGALLWTKEIINGINFMAKVGTPGAKQPQLGAGISFGQAGSNQPGAGLTFK